MSPQPKFYGKYRGTVVDNRDPQQLGRLQVSVPSLDADYPSTWAEPCAPVAGTRSGFFAVPEIGSRVWIEYEQGERDHPIWVGCYWDRSGIPPLAHTAPLPISAITLQTRGQNGLTITDLPGPNGGLKVQSAGGATLIVNDSGIYLRNGKGASIVLEGAKVSINDDALTVT